MQISGNVWGVHGPSFGSVVLVEIRTKLLGAAPIGQNFISTPRGLHLGINRINLWIISNKIRDSHEKHIETLIARKSRNDY